MTPLMFVVWIYLTAVIVLIVSLYLGKRAMNRPFNFSRVGISNMGNSRRNPKGWWWFNIGFSTYGAVYLGLHIFTFPQMHSVFPNYAIFNLILAITGGLGSILVANISENRAFRLHYLMGVQFFMGLGLNMLFSTIFMIYQSLANQYWILISAPFILSLLIDLLAVLLLLKWMLGAKHFEALNPSEWLLLLLLMVWGIIYFGSFIPN